MRQCAVQRFDHRLSSHDQCFARKDVFKSAFFTEFSEHNKWWNIIDYAFTNAKEQSTLNSDCLGFIADKKHVEYF
jgi:hypothetical protein